MSGKDKKARQAALRDFLIAIPDAIDGATVSLGRLVLLGAIALALLMALALFGPHHRPPPPPGGPGENPASALYVRDLGRLPDGRHWFDLVYDLVLRNDTGYPFALDATRQRLALGDAAGAGDAVVLPPAPGVFDSPDKRDGWTTLARQNSEGTGALDLLPGHWRALTAHYRLVARPEQRADVGIGYTIRRAQPGWFGQTDALDRDAHDETVQLGAVVRAHCPLGVKIRNAEVTSPCGR